VKLKAVLKKTQKLDSKLDELNMRENEVRKILDQKVWNE